MTLEEISAAIMNLSDQDKKRVITEVVPAIWQTVRLDQTCIACLRGLLHQESTREYTEEHMGGV